MPTTLAPPTPAQQRILDAAGTCFAARGFHGTSTRDIAREAGLSPAVLYVHYPSKEEVLHEIARRGHEATLEVMRSARMAAGPDPVAQLAHVAHDFVLWHAEMHTLARVINYELAALTDEHRAQIATRRREIEQLTRDILDAGIRIGVFTTDRPGATALAILSLGVDVARWFRDDGEWTPRDVAAHYRDLVLRMVTDRTTDKQRSSPRADGQR